MNTPLPEHRSELITHLQRLWQSNPGSYWPALRQSGLTTQEVWPEVAVQTDGVEQAKPVRKR